MFVRDQDARLSTGSSVWSVDQCQRVGSSQRLIRRCERQKKKKSLCVMNGVRTSAGMQSLSTQSRSKVQNPSGIWGPLESGFHGKFHWLSVAKLWWLAQVVHVWSRNFPKYPRTIQRACV